MCSLSNTHLHTIKNKVVQIYCDLYILQILYYSEKEVVWKLYKARRQDVSWGFINLMTCRDNYTQRYYNILESFGLHHFVKILRLVLKVHRFMWTSFTNNFSTNKIALLLMFTEQNRQLTDNNRKQNALFCQTSQLFSESIDPLRCFLSPWQSCNKKCIVYKVHSSSWTKPTGRIITDDMVM